MTPYQKYLKAEHNINEGLIRLGLSTERPEGYVKNPEHRMDAMRSFLSKCGNPQFDLPAVHVAGTSGKGSVCAAIAGILREAGLNVGLHVSPYLQSATEKIWINDKFISVKQFVELIEWITPIAKPLVNANTPASIHGMASVAIALEAFKRAKLDIIVFEAGCGARFDLTSFVNTKTAVITNVGLDHLISLGPSIEQIAWHKAGVARSGVPLITGAQGSALKIIQKEADMLSAPIEIIPKTISALDHNRAIAISAAKQTASHLGITLSKDTINQGLTRVRLAARIEIMPKNITGPRIVLDGAHNAEKLAVAVSGALKGSPPGPKIAVVGFLGSKANDTLISVLKGKFDMVIATEPRVYAKTAYPAAATLELLNKAGINAIAIPDPFSALSKAVEAAGAEGIVMIAGSFYLAGELRDTWFPKEQVVLQRTSWPQAQAAN